MSSESHKIRGTKVTSPYAVQLTPAEIRLIHSLEHFFAPENIFVDYYLPKPDFDATPQSAAYGARFAHTNTTSNTALTQIDCFSINEQGIFVFESKDFTGWIYGCGSDRYWTESLNFGREKHRFYNPIRQNQLHIAALTTTLKTKSNTTSSDNTINHLPKSIPVFSFIVFGQNSTLKSITDLPKQNYVCTQLTLRSTLNRFLESTPTVFSTSEINNLHNFLNRSRIIPDLLTRQTHIIETPHLKP